jgi:hypothetical protein
MAAACGRLKSLGRFTFFLRVDGHLGIVSFRYSLTTQVTILGINLGGWTNGNCDITWHNQEIYHDTSFRTRLCFPRCDWKCPLNLGLAIWPLLIPGTPFKLGPTEVGCSHEDFGPVPPDTHERTEKPKWWTWNLIFFLTRSLWWGSDGIFWLFSHIFHHSTLLNHIFLQKVPL